MSRGEMNQEKTGVDVETDQEKSKGKRVRR